VVVEAKNKPPASTGGPAVYASKYLLLFIGIGFQCFLHQVLMSIIA
jgi:hypothetical protein